MALTRTKKKDIIKKINNIAKKSLSIITANPSGVQVNNINTLRKNAKKSKVKIYITRNTLLKKSLEKTDFSSLIKVLNGPNLIAFSIKHPGSASRLFKEFSKKNNTFKIQYAVYNKKLLSLEEINNLAELPTYKESVIKFIFILKEIAIGKLLRALYQISQKST